MQNELTLEENMELARKFVQEQFVTKGMIADLAFHSPEKEAVSYTHLDVYKRQSMPSSALKEHSVRLTIMQMLIQK